MLNSIVGFLGNGAGGGGASFESIATATGTGSSGTITFSSIPSTYKHLQIRGIARQSALGSNTRECQVRFNSDSGSNYQRHALIGTGSAVNAGYSSPSATETWGVIGVSTGATANAHAATLLDVHDYASATKYKTIRSFAGGDLNGSGQIYLISGLWMSTSAITSIQLIADSGNWNSTTVFALYGIKG